MIGELLRATRERHGLTQARLARRIGADRGYVSRVERGDVSPTFEWVERALAAMGEELAVGVRRSRWHDHDPGRPRRSPRTRATEIGRADEGGELAEIGAKCRVRLVDHDA